VIIKAGTVVYRVEEDDPPPDVHGPHSWKTVARTVEKASARQIKLRTPFPGHFRVLYPPDALGRVFFETPLQAIRHFLVERRLEIESLDRRLKEAARAVAWAEGQAATPSACRACDGDGFLAIDSDTPSNERLTRDSRVCTYCGGTGASREGDAL
jgi:hypothetical protein